MTTDPIKCKPSDRVEYAAKVLKTSKISSLFVCDFGKPVGILHFHDVISILGNEI